MSQPIKTCFKARPGQSQKDTAQWRDLRKAHVGWTISVPKQKGVEVVKLQFWFWNTKALYPHPHQIPLYHLYPCPHQMRQPPQDHHSWGCLEEEQQPAWVVPEAPLEYHPRPTNQRQSICSPLPRVKWKTFKMSCLHSVLIFFKSLKFSL